MNLEEKAGLMFHMIAGVNPDGSLNPPPHGFSRGSIAELVNGVVCTDWGLISDTRIGNMVMVARAWGVEHLTPLE